jgi:ribosome-binding protein aMBF1 (putative translation factor)
MAKKTHFQKDLEKQMLDSAFAAEYERELAELEIAGKIHQLRIERGLSQRDLAKKVGTSQSVIARLENAGYHGHSTTMLTRIAQSLGAKLVIDFKSTG